MSNYENNRRKSSRIDMETKFNFNSQICTTREQSEHLLALGLKKETADMHHYRYSEGYWDIQACPPRGDSSSYIPAWSLHRLINLIGNIAYDWIFRNDDCYTNAINCIEWLIKEGYFNKKYLV